MAAINLKTLGRSTLFGILAELWRIGSRLVISPIVIAAVGLEGYGTWALVFSVAAYLSSVNASFGVAYSRYTAELARSEQWAQLGRICAAGMVSLGALALFVFATSFWWGAPLLRALQLPPALVDDAAIALWLVFATLVLRMSVGSTLEILAGLQRLDITYRISIVASIIEFLIVLPLLYAGFGLIGLAIGFAVGQVFSFAWAWREVRRHAPLLRIRPFEIERESVVRVFSLGGRFQLLAFSHTIVTEGLKFVISVVVGVQAVAAYDLCDKLVTLSRAAIAAISAPMMPALAHLQAGDEHEEERHLMIRATRVSTLVGTLCLAFATVLADSIIFAWTGERVPLAALALRVVFVGEFATILTGMMSANARARGSVRPEMESAFAFGIVLFSTIVPFTYLLEFLGLVLARSLSGLAFSGWFFFRFSRITTGMGAFDYLLVTRVHRTVLLTAVAATTVMLGRALGAWLGLGEATSRGQSALEVIVWGTLYGLIAAIGAWRYVLDHDDRSALTNLVAARLRRRRTSSSTTKPVDP